MKSSTSITSIIIYVDIVNSIGIVLQKSTVSALIFNDRWISLTNILRPNQKTFNQASRYTKSNVNLFSCITYRWRNIKHNVKIRFESTVKHREWQTMTYLKLFRRHSYWTTWVGSPCRSYTSARHVGEQRPAEWDQWRPLACSVRPVVFNRRAENVVLTQSLWNVSILTEC